MNHRAIQKLLDDYVDGTLTRSAQRDTERHLETCAVCRSRVSRLRDLLDRAAALTEGVSPPRDLWPELRSRLASGEGTGESAAPVPREFPSRVPPGFREALAAAAAVALLWGGARMLSPIGVSPPGIPVAAHSGAPMASPLSPMLEGMVRGLERETLGTGAAMAGGERGRNAPGAVDAETALSIDRGLGALDLAIEESLVALRADPENTQLLRRLAVYYRLRLDLLHRAAVLSRNA